MPENLPSLQDILEPIQENLSALTDSLNQCFDTQFQMKPGEPIPWQEDHPAINLSGMPGLCVVFRPIDDRGYLIAIPETMPLPTWYREPDETQQSRLQTLAMEWSYGMLPEDFQEGGYSSLASNDLITAVSGSSVNEQTQMVEIQLLDQQGEKASKDSLWLIGPLESPSLGNEEEELDEEPAAEMAPSTATDNKPVEQTAEQHLESNEVIDRIRRLMPMKVNVSVRLAEKKIKLSQLQGLGPGALITFPKSCDDLLDMYVNNKLYAQGEAVKIGENFGLKVNDVGTVIERPPGIFTL